jgi:hypothetical protein
MSSLDAGAVRPLRIRRAARWIRWVLRLGGAGTCVAAVVSATRGSAAAMPVTFGVLTVVLLVIAAHAERATIRFLPEPLRTFARQSFLDGESTRASARLFRRGSGNPHRVRHVFATEAATAKLAARPRIVYQAAASEILWTGRYLRITDARGRAGYWYTASGGVSTDFLPAVIKSRVTVRTAPPTGNAFVVALAVMRTKQLPVDTALLLDQHSRRVGMVPVRGFDEAQIAAVAKQAGLEYSLFELPSRPGSSAEALIEALFPRSVWFSE